VNYRNIKRLGITNCDITYDKLLMNFLSFGLIILTCSSGCLTAGEPSYIRIERRDMYSSNSPRDEPEVNSTNQIENNPAHYLGILSLGVMTGPGLTVFSIMTIHGEQVGDHSSIGIGLGFDYYPDVTVIPVFLDLRTYLLEKQVSPFLFLDVGLSKRYYKSFSNEGANGIILGGGPGCTIPVIGQVSPLLDVGDKYQNHDNFFVTTIGISF